MDHLFEHFARAHQVFLSYKLRQVLWPHTLRQWYISGHSVCYYVVVTFIFCLYCSIFDLCLYQKSIPGMKRNLLIIGALLLAVSAVFAQKKKKSKPSYIGGSYSGTGLEFDNSVFLFPKKTDKPEIGFDYKQPGAPLPDFVIINKESIDITGKVINDANLLLIMFSPLCDHCEEETRMLIKNLFLFKKSNILMVAAPVQTKENISFFNATTKFAQYPATIKVAIDSANVLGLLFNYNNLPQINVYDGKDHRLLHTFNGNTPLDSLKQYIQ
jgi:hypothetical protein